MIPFQRQLISTTSAMCMWPMFDQWKKICKENYTVKLIDAPIPEEKCVKRDLTLSPSALDLAMDTTVNKLYEEAFK